MTAVVAIAAAMHRQHSAATTVVTPPGTSSEGTLEATCALLRNPLGPNTSPSAMEQWCHDVNKFIIIAINTLLRGGWWPDHSGGMLESSAAHSRTPLASLATSDLRVELERRRSGEYVHITIECRRKKHRNH
jgi:hypothetical protein